MDYETKRRLKGDQLTLAIAMLNCSNESAKDAVKGIWKDLLELEYGLPISDTAEVEEDTAKRWLAEYEWMKSKEVKLTRSARGLAVTGLAD